MDYSKFITFGKITPKVKRRAPKKPKIIREPPPEKPDILVCPYCQFSTKHTSSFRYHVVEKHTKDYLYNCPQCSKGFVTEYRLKEHIQRKHGENSGMKDHYCATCKKDFPNRTALRQHRQQEHRDLHCTDCEFSTWCQKSMWAHRHIHSGETRCIECGKVCASRKSLKVHFRVLHSGEKPFVCDSCGQGFSYKTNLENHQKNSHPDLEEERNLQCKVCKRVFTRICYLLRHRRIHERNVKCLRCDKTYSRLGYLKLHVRREHSQNCHLCDKPIATGNMRKHIRIMHKGAKKRS